MEAKPRQFTENSGQFFRFQVIQGEFECDGRLKKSKSVGMAYLKEGQNMYTLRLWTFVNEKFYLIPSKTEPMKYLVMTREPNKSPQAKNKYFWNIVGNGNVDSTLGAIKLDFDLFSKTVYVNIHPEKSTFSVNLPEPDFEVIAA